MEKFILKNLPVAAIPTTIDDDWNLQILNINDGADVLLQRSGVDWR